MNFIIYITNNIIKTLNDKNISSSASTLQGEKNARLDFYIASTPSFYACLVAFPVPFLDELKVDNVLFHSRIRHKCSKKDIMRSYSRDLSGGIENVPVLIEKSVPKEAFSDFQVMNVFTRRLTV